MFSKKHYINWFSLIFIIISIVILTLNFQSLKEESFPLFVNLSASILLAITFFITDKYLNPDKIDLYIISFAFIASFLSYLSYFPLGFYLIFLLFFFRNNVKNLSLTVILILLFDLLIKYYMKGNYYGDIFYWDFPLGWIILLYILSIYSGWMTADMHEAYFSTGIIIFLWTIIFWFSNDKEYLNSSIIASFLISIPFFISSFGKYKVDKFLGKVYKNL